MSLHQFDIIVAMLGSAIMGAFVTHTWTKGRYYVAAVDIVILLVQVIICSALFSGN
jgi:hypothetical protein